jgi:hypothetical protein
VDSAEYARMAPWLLFAAEMILSAAALTAALLIRRRRMRRQPTVKEAFEGWCKRVNSRSARRERERIRRSGAPYIVSNERFATGPGTLVDVYRRSQGLGPHRVVDVYRESQERKKRERLNAPMVVEVPYRYVGDGKEESDGED